MYFVVWEIYDPVAIGGVVISGFDLVIIGNLSVVGAVSVVFVALDGAVFFIDID